MTGLVLFLIYLFFVLLLPRGTNVPYDQKPRITIALLLANLGMHVITQLVEWSGGTPIARIAASEFSNSALKNYYDALALTPSKLSSGEPIRYIQLLTANFLHADWLHLLGNLWFFYLFSVNLEDLFGRKRFAIFMIFALLMSQGCILLFVPPDAPEYALPHLGFSGVVYAVIAAYLVCFTRSRIIVILIYSPAFWILVFTVGGMLALISSLLIGTAAELVLIAWFIGLFIYMQPGNVTFGLPAWIFLGYRFLMDGVTMQEQMDAHVSVWCHAGGFLAGLFGGLIVNGTKGLYQTWQEEEPPQKIGRKQAEKQLKESLKDRAEHDEGAARDLLGRLAFLGDTRELAGFYQDTIMVKHPKLTLDSNGQLALARKLDASGHVEAAIHAYDNLLDNYEASPGIEAAYVNSARLTLKSPPRIPGGLANLEKFLSLQVLNRDKLEARQLWMELLAVAEANKVEIPEKFREIPEFGLISRKVGPTAEEPSDEWERRLKGLESSEGFLPSMPRSRKARMGQLEMPEESALTGKEPLPMKSLFKAVGIDPESVDDNKLSTRTDNWDGLIESAPLPANTESPISMDQLMGGKAAASPANPGTLPPPPPQPPKHEEKSVGPAIEVRSGPSLDQEPSAVASRGKAQDEQLFGMPPIAKSSQSAATPAEKPIPAAPPTKTKSFAILLSEGTSVPTEALIGWLAKRVGGEERARGELAEGRGVIVRGLAEGEAIVAREELRNAGVSCFAVAESHPAMESEPVEVLSLTINLNSLLFKSQTDVLRANPEDIVLVNLAACKLSPKSPSYKNCIELVAAPRMTRIQIWERTLSASGSSLNGVALPKDDAFRAVIKVLRTMVPDRAMTLAARQAADDFSKLVKFDTFMAYEHYMESCILSRLGERLP
ncbi:MAG: rhomboid family intramembrane serine protease [Candidatus Sumerlaeaceae bacterium]|nr:rhomboid family intramembrane serine protease [Candidatus Sumerlaeaceae bacterium]